MEELVDEQVRLSRAGTGTDVDDLGVAQDGVLLLVVQAGKLVGRLAPDEFHGRHIGEDLRRQIDEPDQHAVIDHEGLLVDPLVLVDDIVELVLEAESRLGHVIVFAPLVEFLEGVGVGSVRPGDLLVEIVRDGPDRLGLVGPVAVRLEVEELEHVVILLYSCVCHGRSLYRLAKFGFAARDYLCCV